MIYTLFFSHRREMDPDTMAEYESRFAKLKRCAADEYPGFVDTKSFTADDGERLTVVRFRDEESQRAWSRDALHREAQQKGRTDYYERYRIVVCQAMRSYDWERQPIGPATRSDEGQAPRKETAA